MEKDNVICVELCNEEVFVSYKNIIEEINNQFIFVGLIPSFETAENIKYPSIEVQTIPYEIDENIIYIDKKIKDPNQILTIIKSRFDEIETLADKSLKLLP